MTRVHAAVLASMAVLVASNCSTEVCACPPLIESASVGGHVMDQNSTPVPGARIRAYSAMAVGCRSLNTDFGFVLTAADGSFRMGLPTGAQQDSTCVFVFARPPLGSSDLGDSDTALVILNFRPSQAPDEARLDLVLRSNP
jgi:hypothetical protein